MSSNVLSGTRVLVAAAVLLLAACADSDSSLDGATSASTPPIASTTGAPATIPITVPITVPAAVPITVPITVPAAAAPATSVVLAEGALAVFDFAATQLAVGTSIEGRPITADRYGTPGGRRVLVIGVIHGDEDAGVAIIEELRERDVPDGVELWVIESMNPDGQAAQNRQNANQVDLNRNFPHKWGVIGEPGNSQYAGTGPASEPETQAMVNLITQLRPDIAVWYHQDANLIIPSTGRDGRIRARYAELTALPLADCCGGGGVYTGIAATWAKNELQKDSNAVAFIVELPGGVLSTQQVNAHANAVLTIGIEG